MRRPLVFSLVLLVCSYPFHAQTISIPGPGGPLEEAAVRLRDYLGSGTWTVDTTGGPGEVQVLVDPTLLAGVAEPDDRYTIDRDGPNPPLTDPVRVRGGNPAGATSGLHGLRRRLMLEGVLDPATLAFDEVVVPTYRRRGIMVSLPPFAGQQDRRFFGADLFSYADWEDYVEFLRLLNATHLTVAPGGLYDAQDPRTLRQALPFDVLADVMDLCHDLGMEFNVVLAPSWVTQDFFWDNFQGPHFRVGTGEILQESESIGPRDMDRQHVHPLPYHGISVALPVVRQDPALEAAFEAVQSTLFTTFAEADAFTVIFNEGGSDYGVQTVQDPVGELDAALAHVQAQLDAASSDAAIEFWGWLHDYWFRWQLDDATYSDHPAFQGFNLDGVTTVQGYTNRWLQETSTFYAYLPGWSTIASAYPGGLPNSLVDPLGEAAKRGLEVSAFLYWQHAEVMTNAMPRPMLEETITELYHAQRPPNLPPLPLEPPPHRATGVTGYRLTPNTRRINDYAILRFAEDDSFVPLAIQSSSKYPGQTLAYEVLLAEIAQYVSGGTFDYVDDVEESIHELDQARRPFVPRDLGGLWNAVEAIDDVDWWNVPRLEEYFYLVLFTQLVEDLAFTSPFASIQQTVADPKFAAILEIAKQTPVLRAFSSQHAWVPENKAVLLDFVNRIRLQPF